MIAAQYHRESRSAGRAGIAQCIPALALGAGLITLLLPADEWRRFPDGAVVWATFLVLLALAGYQRWAAVRANDNPWMSAGTLTLNYYLLRFGVGALIIFYWDQFPWEAFPWLRDRYYAFGARENLTNACRLILLGGLGLCVGFSIPVRRLVSAVPRVSWPIDRSKLARTVMWYGPVGAGLLFFSVKFPGSLQFGAFLLGSLNYVLIVISAYWAFSPIGSAQQLRWGLTGLGLCALCVPLGLNTGMVMDTVISAVMFAMGYVLARGRLPWRFIVLASPALLIAFSFLTAYKTTREWGPHLSIPDRLWMTREKLRAEGARSQFEAAFDRFVGRTSLADLTAVFSRYYPQVYPYIRGRSFGIEFSTFIPRLFWPDRPSMNPELNLYSAGVGLVKQGPTETEGNASMVFDAVSEYHVNFGPAGVLALCIVHAIYLSFLYQWLLANLKRPMGAGLFAVLFALNWDFFGIGQMIVNHVKTIPVWLILLYLLSRLGREQQTAQAKVNRTRMAYS